MWASVRLRLLLLILLAMLPASGLGLYHGLEDRRMARVQTQHEVLRLARIAASEYERLMGEARPLLVALTHLPVVRMQDAAACRALFASILKQYPIYANLGAIEPDGNVWCSALPLSSPVNLADRAYFRRVVETRDFAIGDYQISRITGKATINLGYPLLDGAKRVQGVVFAALELTRLNRLAADARLPTGSVLTVIDDNGTILVGYPDPEQRVGRIVSELPLAKAVLSGGGGVIEASGTDGIRRLYGLAPLRDGPRRSGLAVRIGISTSTAYAEADRLLILGLIGHGLVGALALVAAWAFADRFILRGVGALMHGAERLKAGDLTARVEVTERGELGSLAVRFNEMADRLQGVHDQLASRVEELKHQAQELNLLREIDLMLLAEAPLQELLDKAVEAFASTAGSQTCVLVTASPEGGELTPVATFGPDLEGIRQYFATLKPRVGEEGGALGRAIVRRAPVVISDIPSSAEIEWYRDVCARLGIRAVLAVPLVTDHQVLGAVGIGYPTARSFSEAEVTTIKGVASQLAVALEQARLRGEAKHRRRLEKALNASRRLFQAVVQSSPDAIIIADGSARIVSCNAGAQRLLGYTEEELLGMSVSALMPERYREAHRQGLKRFQLTGEARIIGTTIEGDALRKDGRDVPVALSLASWKIDNEMFYSAILHDITERRRYTVHLEKTVEEKTRTLREANQQLETASRHKSEFLNNMSHELRTPLNSIIGFSEILRDPAFGSLTDKQARFAHNILTAGKHLLVLVNGLLDLSRIEAGKIDFQPGPFVLQEALEAAVTEIRPQADQKRLDLRLDLEAAPSTTLTADPVRFKQILLNLLSNAVKFTPEGGRITVTASVRGETSPHALPLMPPLVEIAVTDTGIGIKPDGLPRLFQEFVRLDAAVTQRISGTGLGLALTRKLVELHGGTISAASEGEGRGSTFTVRLPRTRTPPCSDLAS